MAVNPRRVKKRYLVTASTTQTMSVIVAAYSPDDALRRYLDSDFVTANRDEPLVVTNTVQELKAQN